MADGSGLVVGGACQRIDRPSVDDDELGEAPKSQHVLAAAARDRRPARAVGQPPLMARVRPRGAGGAEGPPHDDVGATPAGEPGQLRQAGCRSRSPATPSGSIAASDTVAGHDFGHEHVSRGFRIEQIAMPLVNRALDLVERPAVAQFEHRAAGEAAAVRRGMKAGCVRSRSSRGMSMPASVECEHRRPSGSSTVHRTRRSEA